MRGWQRLDLGGTVSIRSPHRSEGRFFHQHLKNKALLFQSAPPTEVRGDTLIPEILTLFSKVSIRSPHRSEGRFPSLSPTVAPC